MPSENFIVLEIPKIGEPIAYPAKSWQELIDIVRYNVLPEFPECRFDVIKPGDLPSDAPLIAIEIANGECGYVINCNGVYIPPYSANEFQWAIEVLERRGEVYTFYSCRAAKTFTEEYTGDGDKMKISTAIINVIKDYNLL